MKRTLALATVIAATIAPAALAGNATVYAGELVDVPKSSAQLKTVKRAGGRYFKSFVAEDFTAPCEGDAELRLDSAFARGLERIGDRGGFRVKGSNQGETIKVSGEVGKRKATGRFRFTSVETVDGREVDCDSGRLEWKVRR